MTKDDIATTIIEMFAEKFSFSPERLTMDSSLINDLGLDSFTMVEIAHEIKVTYGINLPQSELANIKTIGDIVKIITAHAN